MTYLNIMVGVSFGLAITVTLVILTDKSIWKAWTDSFNLRYFTNVDRQSQSATNVMHKESKNEKMNEIKPELEERVIALQLRNRFYRDGKFHMP